MTGEDESLRRMWEARCWRFHSSPSTETAARDGVLLSSRAGEPEEANRLYEAFKKSVAARGIKVESGVFQAHMLVEIANDGPVTLILEKESGSGESRKG